MLANIRKVANTSPEEVSGLTSVYPTVEIVMMVIYQASSNVKSSIYMKPRIPDANSAARSVTATLIFRKLPGTL